MRLKRSTPFLSLLSARSSVFRPLPPYARHRITPASSSLSRPSVHRSQLPELPRLNSSGLLVAIPTVPSNATPIPSDTVLSNAQAIVDSMAPHLTVDNAIMALAVLLTAVNIYALLFQLEMRSRLKQQSKFDLKEAQREAADETDAKHAATTTLELEKQKHESNLREASTQHEPPFVKQVVNALKQPYSMPKSFMNQIGGLPFVPRDPARTTLLNNILSTPGELVLFEGPSGSGKTTHIKHALQERRAPAIYWSARANQPSLYEFARAFGIDDLPANQDKNVLSIVRRGLALHAQANPQPASVPVLVIDDVQKLLSVDHGRAILFWCLEAACNSYLTVIFVSSESVQSQMRSLSGFSARLSVEDDAFDYIAPANFKAMFVQIQHPWPTFSADNAELLISKCGTHMTDLFQVQTIRLWTQGFSFEQAIDKLVIKESILLKQCLTANFDAYMSSALLRERMRPLVALRICDILAARVTPMEMHELDEAVKAGEWSSNCATELQSQLVCVVTNELVQQNVLRRFCNPKECITFHRPVKRVAFLALKEEMVYQNHHRNASRLCLEQPASNEFVKVNNKV